MTISDAKAQASRYFIREPAGLFRGSPLPPGGTQPIAHGAVVLPGPVLWPDEELRRVEELARTMIQQARVVLAPRLALPDFVRPETPLDKQDLRPVTTPFGRWQTVRGCTTPTVGAVFVALSSVVAPSDILRHEAFHFAENCLFSEDELQLVAQAYRHHVRMSEAVGIPRHPEPDEWAAGLFERWCALSSYVGAAVIEGPLQELFTALETGDMQTRNLIHGRSDVRDIYRAMAGLDERRAPAA